ncbi:MAG TPA: hypothetical protein EYN67_11525 [Flavobacteriales bacterium]|nr:hypothetical protein [Flavobacteriales bacterium]
MSKKYKSIKVEVGVYDRIQLYKKKKKAKSISSLIDGMTLALDGLEMAADTNGDTFSVNIMDKVNNIIMKSREQYYKELSK